MAEIFGVQNNSTQIRFVAEFWKSKQDFLGLFSRVQEFGKSELVVECDYELFSIPSQLGFPISDCFLVLLQEGSDCVALFFFFSCKTDLFFFLFLHFGSMLKEQDLVSSYAQDQPQLSCLRKQELRFVQGSRFDQL